MADLPLSFLNEFQWGIALDPREDGRIRVIGHNAVVAICMLSTGAPRPEPKMNLVSLRAFAVKILAELPSPLLVVLCDRENLTRLATLAISPTGDPINRRMLRSLRVDPLQEQMAAGILLTFLAKERCWPEVAIHIEAERAGLGLPPLAPENIQ